MKPKLPFNKEYSETLKHIASVSGVPKKYWIERNLPSWWWLHPILDFGLKYPMPYIWFIYWLITWEEDEEHEWGRIFTGKHVYLPLRYISYLSTPMFRFIKVSISFMPD